MRFAREVEPALRMALTAGHGFDRGLEATNDVLVYAWKHWDRISTLDNPAGYLYRVGRSRKPRSAVPIFAPVPTHRQPEVEPGLPAALGSLSEKQRLAVVMVHAYEWSRGETAAMLEISVSTLDTRLQRGLAKLRESLGVESHA